MREGRRGTENSGCLWGLRRAQEQEAQAGLSGGGRNRTGTEQEAEMKQEAFLGFLPPSSPWFPALGFWEPPQDP